MSLRTYSLITHPAFTGFIDSQIHPGIELQQIAPRDIPAHRPRIDHVYDIADYLGVSHEVIRSAILFKTKHYRTFSLHKRNGEFRVIASPRTSLKVIQWWILDTILCNAYVEPFVYGFVRGRSFIQNAKAHAGASYILNVDVKEFFDSVSVDMVQSAFTGLGYSESASEGITKLVTLSDRLPQGAPRVRPQ